MLKLLCDHAFSYSFHSTVTKCLTLRIMPRVSGVSFNSTL